MFAVLALVCSANPSFTVENKIPPQIAEVAMVTVPVSAGSVCTVDAFGRQTCSTAMSVPVSTPLSVSTTAGTSQPVYAPRVHAVRDWLANRPRLFGGRIMKLFGRGSCP